MSKSKKVWIQFGVIAVLLLSCVGVALAWFVNYKYNRVVTPKIQIVAGDFMQISSDGETWNNQVIIESAKLRWDVTGDGVTLWRPRMDESGARPDLTNQANWMTTSATPHEDGLLDYIEVPLTLRSDRPLNIYLGSNCKVTPVCPEDKVLYANDPESADWDNVENMSNFSSSTVRFSRNYMAGAVRVAILQRTGTVLERKALWVPNPDYELVTSPSYDFKEVGEDELTYNYYTYTASGTTAEKTLRVWSAKDIRHSFSSGKDPAPDEADFVMQMQPGTDGLYYANLVVRIWIEGTDREARLALAGGEFDVDIQFVAVSAGQTTEATEAPTEATDVTVSTEVPTE